MPPGSPHHQSPPSLPPTGPFGTSRSPEAFGSSQVPPPPPSPPTTSQEGFHLLRQDWWKQLEEDRPATPEPAWSIPSSDVPISKNNWASALVSTYSPPPEDSLLAQTGDMAMFMDWFCKRQRMTKLKPQDLEGPAFELVKVFHPNVINLQYQIEECHQLLIDSVDNSIIRHNVSKPLPLGGPPGQVTIQSDFFFNKDLEYLRYGSKGIRSALSISKDATGFEYKHDYTVIESSRAVTFWEKYEVQMIMRFNEIHKFSDGTLHRIDEALDYRVKEFKVNRTNSGLNTRFWTRKDVDRSKEFMFAIQKRLKTLRIFRNLKSFIGGRVRDGDYRVRKHTE
nr:hypothetical protein [Tanacetum cinerariifolium]